MSFIVPGFGWQESEMGWAGYSLVCWVRLYWRCDSGKLDWTGGKSTSKSCGLLPELVFLWFSSEASSPGEHFAPEDFCQLAWGSPQLFVVVAVHQSHHGNLCSSQLAPQSSTMQQSQECHPVTSAIPCWLEVNLRSTHRLHVSGIVTQWCEYWKRDSGQGAM